jgi:hypothetical protein
VKYLAQFLAYAAFAAIVGLLSVWPEYRLLAPDQAVVSLTISHAGQRIRECRRLTQDELNELPPNMRKPTDCPRERHPIRVELRADGSVLFQETAPPSGLWSDGKATVYRRIQMDAGRHELFVGMNDSGGEDEFDFVLQSNLALARGQNLVIDFDELQQTFVFR